MEIFDCFCGVGQWAHRDPLLPWEPERILELMDHFGVARALVFSNAAADHGWAPNGNEYAAQTARKNRRFVPAFVLAPHPYKDSLSVEGYAQAMKAAGAKAAWLCPQGQGHGLWSWLIGDLLALCSEKRVPVLIHAEGFSPDDIHRIAREFHDLRLILAGVGYGSDMWLFPILRDCPEVRVSLGHFYHPSNGPMRFLDHFPAERLLFGSGLPHFSPGGLIAHVMYATISSEAKAKILSGNLDALLSEVRL